MEVVLNLANCIYVLKDMFEGSIVYRLSSNDDEVFCNEDESFQYRMNPEVYRLILEEFGANTYYFQTEAIERVVSFKQYERTFVQFEEIPVFAESHFRNINQAMEVAQFLFELFARGKESVCCEFRSSTFNREITWKGVEFLLQVNEEGKVDGEVVVTIPSERIYDSTQLEFENKIKMIGGAEITYQGHIVDLKVDSLTQSFLLVANLV